MTIEDEVVFQDKEVAEKYAEVNEVITKVRHVVVPVSSGYKVNILK
jgi:hypothetical protein